MQNANPVPSRPCGTVPTRNAHFTLADPTPRLASDVVGGKSGQNHPTSHRYPIHIGRMARNAYIRAGWYSEGVLFITTPSERQLHCTPSAPNGRWRRALLNMFNIGRRPPYGLPMRPRQPMPGQEPIHIGRPDSLGAQLGRRIG